MKRDSIRTLTAFRGQDDSALRSVLESLPGFDVEVCSNSYEQVLARGGLEDVQAAFVYLDGIEDEGLKLVGRLMASQPDLAVFVVSEKPGTDLVVSSIRAGAADVVAADAGTADLLKHMVRLVEVRRKRPGGGCHKLVTVFSPRGGVGVTTLAINLAVSLKQQTGARVALVDLDLQNGEVPAFLNFRHPYSILDLVENVDNLDPVFLQATLYQHSSGVAVLPAPPMLEDSESLSGSDVAAVLKALKAQYDYVVVDTPPVLNDVVLPALEAAEPLYLLTGNTIPAIRALQRVCGTLKRVGLTPDNIKLVVAGAAAAGEVTDDDIADVSRLPVSGCLPADPVVAASALGQGRSVFAADEDSKLAVAIRAIAARLAGPAAVVQPPQRRGLFSRFTPAGGAS
ncbi:MAG TPA: hypothetical protein EYG16_05955 [Deltaproteobacteria bacterium]|nr:hypothetical protein [Candidatus Binatota bacterium]HIL13198.1 hypothetical protein [Deltaproteobacteria bacterium]